MKPLTTYKVRLSVKAALVPSALLAGAAGLFAVPAGADPAPAAAATTVPAATPAAGTGTGTAATPLDAHAAYCAAAATQKAPMSISDDDFDDLKKAMELIGQKKDDEAIAALNDIADKGGDYDKALINYNLGSAYTDKNDYGNAAKYFSKALSYKVLSQQQNDQLMFNAGQLYVASGQLDEGIKMLQNYVKNSCSKVTPDAHMFLANALAEQKRYPEALQEVVAAESAVKAPKESWLQFQLGIQYEMKDYNACAGTLMQLVAVAPGKADYWKQLSGILLQAKDDDRAAAVMVLAAHADMLEKPEDIKNLYGIYMMIGEPLKAAQLVDTAMSSNKLPADEKSLDLASSAWINARETAKAEDSLKRLANMADRGEYYFRLGAMYGDEERWKESKEMLDRAVEKGGLKRPGDAYFRIAVADYGTGDIKGAIGALQKASNYDESRQQAKDWLNMLQGPAAQGQPGKAAPVPSASREQTDKVASKD